MNALGPKWWGGFLLGLFVGIFVTAMVIETEIVPAPYVKFLRGGAAVGASFTILIGGWGMKRAQKKEESSVGK